MKQQHTHTRKAMLLLCIILLLMAAPIWLYKTSSCQAYADCDTVGNQSGNIMASQSLNPLQLFAK